MKFYFWELSEYDDHWSWGVFADSRLEAERLIVSRIREVYADAKRGEDEVREFLRQDGWTFQEIEISPGIVVSAI